MTTDEQDESPSTLLAYLQLLRLPNVFTAMADVLMGVFVASGTLSPFPSWATVVALVAASSLLYLAGMVLNDVFDVEVDRRERPKRPLPSSAIPLPVAHGLGYGLLSAGIACGWLATGLSQNVRCGVVATILAAAIWLYDRLLKRTPLGPLAMGSCRFLNVLLGMSVSRMPWQTVHWLIAGGMGIYVTGLTWFARKEAKRSSVWQLAAATAVMGVGIGLLAWSPQFVGDTERMLGDFQNASDMGSTWFLLWGILGLSIGYRAVGAIAKPVPARVQLAVKVGIMSIIFFDAALTCGARDKVDGLAIACLCFPAVLLGRSIKST